MTIKQISEITGKSGQAIRMRIRKLYPNKPTENGITVELTSDETFAVLKSYESRHRIEPQRSVAVSSTKREGDYQVDRFESILDKQQAFCREVMDRYYQLVMQVLAGKKPRFKAIAAPVQPGEIGSPRQAFEAAVKCLVKARGIDYDAAHMMVYRDLGRQEGRDFILESGGQRIIDLLEREHLLTEGIRIARKYIDMAVSA